MIVVHVPPAAIALLDEATERGIWIELRGDELHACTAVEDMSQEDLDEFTARLTPHREEVAAAILYFGMAERNGIH